MNPHVLIATISLAPRRTQTTIAPDNKTFSYTYTKPKTISASTNYVNYGTITQVNTILITYTHQTHPQRTKTTFHNRTHTPLTT